MAKRVPEQLAVAQSRQLQSRPSAAPRLPPPHLTLFIFRAIRRNNMPLINIYSEHFNWVPRPTTKKWKKTIIKIEKLFIRMKSIYTVCQQFRFNINQRPATYCAIGLPGITRCSRASSLYFRFHSSHSAAFELANRQAHNSWLSEDQIRNTNTFSRVIHSSLSCPFGFHQIDAVEWLAEKSLFSHSCWWISLNSARTERYSFGSGSCAWTDWTIKMEPRTKSHPCN